MLHAFVFGAKCVVHKKGGIPPAIGRLLYKAIRVCRTAFNHLRRILQKLDSLHVDEREGL